MTAWPLRISSVWLALCIFLLLALAIGSAFRYPLITDDPYITYRYARNLLQGQGFVYNPGQRVLSTTTPLYTLVLAALGIAFRDLPTLGFWLSILSYAVCAWLLYLIASSQNESIFGLLAGGLMLLSPGLLLTFGLETGFYLALAFAAIYLSRNQQIVLAAACLALMTLTRNDGVLLAVILGVDWIVAHRRDAPGLRRILKPLLVYLLVLAPWLLFAWWWFGSPFPFTLTAKIAQAQSGNWDTFAVGFSKWLREWSGAVWLPALFALVGVASSARERSRLTYIALWPAVHLAAYSALGVAFYAWYVAPLWPVLALFSAVGIERSTGFVRGKWVRLAFASILGIAALAFELQADVNSGMQQPSAKVEAYRRAAEWIATNTARDATVDALEVGVIGYYDERRTLDFVGLVDPMRIPYLRWREFADGVRRAAADYVIAIPSDDWLFSDPWFTSAYRRAHEIRVLGFYGGKPLVIFQRGDVRRQPVDSRAIGLSFDRRVELLSVDLMSRSACRGDILPIILYLRAREPLSKEFKFTLQLVGAENRIVAQTDTYYPLRLPEDGQPFADHQGLAIRADATPGAYDLILAMYEQTSGDRLVLFDKSGKDAGDFVSLGKIDVC